jgi:hypothetical protein
MGFVFGYLLYYAVRHTKEFNIDLLSSAIGAVGGGVVLALFDKTGDWVGPYGIGLLSGFLVYFILCLIFIFSGKFQVVAGNKVMIFTQTILGSPKQE